MNVSHWVTFVFRWIIVFMFLTISFEQWKLARDTAPVYLALLGVSTSIVLSIIKYLHVHKPFGVTLDRVVEYLNHVLLVPEKAVDLPKDVGRVFMVLSLLELVLTIWLPLLLEAVEGFVWLKSMEQKSPFFYRRNTFPLVQSALEYFYKLQWLLTLRIEENTTSKPLPLPGGNKTFKALVHILFGLRWKGGMKTPVYWQPSYCLTHLIAPHVFIFSVQIVVEALVVVWGGRNVGRAILLHVTLCFNIVRGVVAFMSLYKGLDAWRVGRCDWKYSAVAVFPCVLWLYSTFVFCWNKWMPIYRKNDWKEELSNTSESFSQPQQGKHSRLRRRK